MVGTLLLNASFRVFPRLSCQARSPLPVKPTPLRIPTPQPHWASLQAEVEAHLRQTIPIKEPLEVFRPMHQLVFAAPHTTVPALCLAACELVGGHRSEAMAAAAALLLSLANAHAHEHLDDSEGANIALLTGDGVVPFGFELLARGEGAGRERAERVVRVIVEISRAVGSGGLIDSQHMAKKLRAEEGMKRVVEKRDGGLHACGAACGAVLGGGSEEEIEKLRRFGFHVGMMRGMAQRGFDKLDVEEQRNLALKELHFFKDTHLHLISTFLNFY